MTRYRLGDRVRIDIPDEMNPDFRYHGDHGIVIDITRDEAETIYTIGLEDKHITMEVTTYNIRPPLEELV